MRTDQAGFPRPARRRRGLAAVGLAGALAALVTLIAPGPATAGVRDRSVVRVVASFDAAQGQNPENLAVDRAGTAYVSWLFAHAVARVTRSGAVTSVALPGGLAAGVALNPKDRRAVTVGVISSDATQAGIWRVPLSAFDGVGAPTRVVPLPTNAFPNGITYASDGTLYVADSVLGRIWRVAPGADTAEVWASDPLLTPTGAMVGGFTLPGANGIKLRGSAVYVSNTSRTTLLRIPVRRDGSAGRVAVVRSGLAIDDFAFDRNGTLIAALILDDRVVAVGRDGRVRTVADKAHDGVENPTSVAVLGGRGHEKVDITCAAYFANPPHPSLRQVALAGHDD
jgi:sugar lactone lactonase YvrE